MEYLQDNGNEEAKISKTTQNSWHGLMILFHVLRNITETYENQGLKKNPNKPGFNFWITHKNFVFKL
jgi:hypothetical protein